MRKPIIAGNWKMNKTPGEAAALVRALAPIAAGCPAVETVVCPPFVALPAVAEALRGTGVGVGAQNMFWAESGAYTGEVAPGMLVGLATYVIIGHSERRQIFGETDEMVNKKVRAALAYGLVPILCVGESLAQNEAGITDEWVGGQVRAAFAGLDAEQARRVVVAYEPIWAIGTGRNATAEVADRVCGLVRSTLGKLYDDGLAQALRILYGGSASEKNIGELMAMPEIDGALVGGASLKAESFGEMLRITAQTKE
jgi:triosephosphate isomerase